MAASYPTAAKAFTTKSDGDDIDASHINDLQDEVTALEAALLTGLLHAIIFGDVSLAGAGPRIMAGAGLMRFVGHTSGFSWTDQNHSTQTMYLTNAGALGVLGLITAFAGLTSSGPLAENAVLSPATITADQNDYAPAGYATSRVLRLASDASRTITGIVAVAGLRLLIVNGGANNIVLAHDSASSSGINRFFCPGLSALTIRPGGAVEVWSDTVTPVWRVVAP
jgi:hypothetical protein